MQQNFHGKRDGQHCGETAHVWRGRARYQLAPRLWVAGGIQYDTGCRSSFNAPQESSWADARMAKNRFLSGSLVLAWR